MLRTARRALVLVLVAATGAHGGAAPVTIPEITTTRAVAA